MANQTAFLEGGGLGGYTAGIFGTENLNVVGNFISKLDTRDKIVILSLPIILPIIYFLNTILIKPLFHPLSSFPGPQKRDSLIFGNLIPIFRAPPGAIHIQWLRKYGKVVRYAGMLGEYRFFTTDPRAIEHVMKNAYDYPKPSQVRGELGRILGYGILFAEGETHKRQKRIINPSFSTSHIKEMVPVFTQHAHKLADKLSSLISSSTSQEIPPIEPSAWEEFPGMKVVTGNEKPSESGGTDDGVTVDIMRWLGRCTLDVIGLAGFGHEFNALENSSSELGAAFLNMTNAGGNTSGKSPGPLFFMLMYLMRVFPFLTKLPLRRVREMKKSFNVMSEESRKILESRKSEIREKQAQGDGVHSKEKDLVSIFLKANMSNETKGKMSDEEVMGQMTTFMLAGQETSSTALTWIVHELCRNPSIQSKLRAEVVKAKKEALANGETEIDVDQLDKLPYLDAVVREVLRKDAPVSSTIRTAVKDDLIPLSSPVQTRSPLTGQSKTVDHIPIKKGQMVFISILGFNMDRDVWGADADVYRPERWLDGTLPWMAAGGGEGDAVKESAVDVRLGGGSIYSNLLTFLGGPRSCIGYRFAIYEIKAILAVLIERFVFEDLGLPVEAKSSIVMRPFVKGVGPGLHVRIREVREGE